jgi:hypothetical protein
MINNQIPSTNNQIMTKISMTKIHKRLAKIFFGYLNIDELVKSPICPIIVIPVLARRSASARRRENGNPVFLNGSLLSQGHRLDSGWSLSR